MRGRLFDGHSAAAHDVVLRAADGMLLLIMAGGAELARWPLPQIECREQPAGDGNAVLLLPGSTARLIVAADLLAPLAQAGVPMRSRAAGTARVWAVALGILLLLCGMGLAVLDAGPRLAARLVPAAWDDAFGRVIEAQMQRAHPLCHGAGGQQALAQLVARLRTAGGIARPVHIVVLDDPTVNALTLPGGHVVVLRGLIDTAQDGGELAGVIAHELGHVAHHDPTTMLLRQLGIGLLAQAMGWNDTLGNGGGIARQMLALSYSRRAEASADAAAQAFLTQAGLRADGLGRFFARLRKDEAGQAEIPWLATHPPTEQRLRHATRSTAGVPPLSDAEWQAVRHMCDP